jgi:hypothetical protein
MTATVLGSRRHRPNLHLGHRLMFVMNPSRSNPRIARANRYEIVAWKMVSRRIQGEVIVTSEVWKHMAIVKEW